MGDDERTYNRGAKKLTLPQAYEEYGRLTMADDILDRMVLAAHRIKFKGESLRKKILLLSHTI